MGLPQHLNAEQRARYVAMLTGSPAATPEQMAVPETSEPAVSIGQRRCRYVGKQIGETACRTCQGSSPLPTRLCTLHDVPCVTATRQPVDGTRWCRTCEDHQPAE